MKISENTNNMRTVGSIIDELYGYDFTCKGSCLSTSIEIYVEPGKTVKCEIGNVCFIIWADDKCESYRTYQEFIDALMDAIEPVEVDRRYYESSM